MWVFLIMKKLTEQWSLPSLSMSTSMKFLATDLVPSLMKLISENWQQFWNSCTGNKLQAIRPTVGGYQQKSSLSRWDEVVINRLRIGHTWCTHSYLLSGADQPECTTCQCPPLTVKHVLVEWIDLQQIFNCFLYGGTKVKGKVDHAPHDSVSGCWSPSPRPWACRWRTTNVCD